MGAELARVKMERDILGKATAHTMQGGRFEVRRHLSDDVLLVHKGVIC